MAMILSIFCSILGVGITLFVLGFRIIRENENGVIVRLGKPTRVVHSGLRWTFFPIDRVARFTTQLINLEFRVAGIITEQGEFPPNSGIKYGQANVGVEPTLYFRWPEDNSLLQTVKIVANPEDISSLNNLFEETILNAFRSAGGCVTWREIVRDRKDFSAKVLNNLTNDLSDPINQACIPHNTINLVIKHVNLPEKLETAITDPEIARLEKEATITRAEGERKKRILEGEGFADARKLLYKAIGKEPESIQKEVLLTLREMAQGTSNTILFQIPSQITDTLGDVFGKGDIAGNFTKFFSGLSDKKKKEFFDWLEEKIVGGGRK
ncbi:MAG: hypothetical protein COS71_00175 [Candidatus Moranbacteria bacterium CG06_land_8_20_14_3_00_40_12]|nr:MAG: hypothetical protein COX31_03540 [Candidatus Moranbacteria bacterium CG23_combo_of_CG06-09_8_20_14_all_40_16]PIU81038.1 MAG: hypothetical protein COS71_00175 [Candidatus Moranbacteria bacterium CG06_land_8_20_14_3_00_40_12]